MFKNHFNSQECIGEINEEPSQTIPDQSLSISEILKRYSHGLPLGGVKVPIYNGEEEDLPDMQTLDLSERQQLLEEAQEDIKRITKRLKHKQDEKKETIPPEKANDNAPA